MNVKTKAIVLSTVKYQEKSLIVKCFTESDGLKSYFIQSAFSTRKSNQKIAYFQPLNLLEIEANHKNKGTLEHIKEVKLAYNYQSISVDFTKNAIVFFLSEVLHHAILEEEKNDTLFAFLETSFLWLDTHVTNPNFHLIFLIELTKFLGFYPQLEDTDANCFEMIEGVFTSYQGVNCLSENESILLKKLMELKFDDISKNFSKKERQVLLKIILDYYIIHLQGFKKPKSLEVLKEIFN
ncbi:DNA repair protein RecO [Flavobacterium urocaniciphilum]|uniref:DNA repair protein RecO n=1 Tax=Flavobacterium urocaniciphilum TaxID=1299341 RepID=A0A1H9BUU0_9FLAO|nr:DNA repair protein RecO [Flavobacterium urocaniciphilum]SEP92680.1 DNA replication and repair protein RecO [Flavobacterium urocaniciphilum]